MGEGGGEFDFTYRARDSRTWFRKNAFLKLDDARILKPLRDRTSRQLFGDRIIRELEFAGWCDCG